MQSVNLYLPELRPKKEWMSAWTASITSLGFILILTIAALLNHFQLNRFEKSIEMLENQKIIAHQRVESIKTKKPAGNAVKLDQEVSRLRELISSRIKINELIEGQSLGNNEGYSSRLTSMASVAHDDIALDHFRFTRGAAFIEMAGQTKKPATVASYVSNLKNESSFNVAMFGSLSIAEKKSQSNVYTFSLGFEPLFDFGSTLAGKP